MTSILLYSITSECYKYVGTVGLEWQIEANEMKAYFKGFPMRFSFQFSRTSDHHVPRQFHHLDQWTRKTDKNNPIYQFREASAIGVIFSRIYRVDSSVLRQKRNVRVVSTCRRHKPSRRIRQTAITGLFHTLHLIRSIFGVHLEN